MPDKIMRLIGYLLVMFATMVMSGAIIMFVILIASLLSDESREYQEHMASSQAIRGDCRGAMEWAARAGSVPFEVVRLCEKGR